MSSFADLCGMKSLSADAILFPDGSLVEDATLVVEDDGTIRELLPEKTNDAIRYKGILVPGFINTHCHLELSHLAGTIPREQKLHGFIRDIVKTRKASGSTGIRDEAESADKLMWENGIQGVGDICNTADTFEIKKQSHIRYHSFIEVFSFDPAFAGNAFADGLLLLNHARDHKLNASIVPHASYSVSENLFSRIREHSEKNMNLWCIHNQETHSENTMFENGKGELVELFQSMGIDFSGRNPIGCSSLQYISTYFPEGTNILLVHNIFTGREDIGFLTGNGYMNNCYFCLCPNANIYIENRLPDIEMLYASGCRITIGTDSLASNHSLSVINELAVIHEHFPVIPVSALLSWATANGADYMKWGDLGRFNQGTRPGIILLENVDDGLITSNSKATRIL